MAEKAIDFSISKVWIVGIATLLTALFIGLAGSNNAQAARVDCGTFTVLHNDRIKNVQFPKGTYDISANKLSCTQAVKLSPAARVRASTSPRFRQTRPDPVRHPPRPARTFVAPRPSGSCTTT